MSLSRARYVILLCLLCGFAAGCGGAAKPAAVRVSLTAPVDGATVVTPGIVILGSIEPKNAVVMVSGKRAQVSNGVFKRPMRLHARLTRIRIVVRAPGYVGSVTEVSVSYRPAGRVAQRSDGGVASSGSVAVQSYNGIPPGSGIAVGALPSSAGSDFVAGCSSAGGSIAGCECVWRQLTKRGFDSRMQFEALAGQWRRSFLSKGVIAYPPVIKNAILRCAAGFRAG